MDWSKHLPLDIDLVAKSERATHLYRVERSGFKICEPQTIRIARQWWREEKVYLAHVDDQVNFTWKQIN